MFVSIFFLHLIIIKINNQNLETFRSLVLDLIRSTRETYFLNLTGWLSLLLWENNWLNAFFWMMFWMWIDIDLSSFIDLLPFLYLSYLLYCPFWTFGSSKPYESFYFLSVNGPLWFLRIEELACSIGSFLSLASP